MKQINIKLVDNFMSKNAPINISVTRNIDSLYIVRIGRIEYRISINNMDYWANQIDINVIECGLYCVEIDGSKLFLTMLELFHLRNEICLIVDSVNCKKLRGLER